MMDAPQDCPAVGIATFDARPISRITNCRATAHWIRQGSSGKLEIRVGGQVASAITPAAIRQYQARRRQQGFSAATVNRETSGLSRMFRIEETRTSSYSSAGQSQSEREKRRGSAGWLEDAGSGIDRATVTDVFGIDRSGRPCYRSLGNGPYQPALQSNVYSFHGNLSTGTAARESLRSSLP
jgi:hypothetical protein